MLQHTSFAKSKPGGKMLVFTFLVLIFNGDRIHADVFQTSRTGSTVKLTQVDGEPLFGSGSLLFDVKSCSKVQLRINIDEDSVVIDIYPNKTSQMKYCSSSDNGDCTGQMLAISGDVHMCGDYTPLWVEVSSFTIKIGEGCRVGEKQLWDYFSYLGLIMANIERLEISSVDNGWWRLGNSACQPVTTPAATNTLTTHSATTPATMLVTAPEATSKSEPLINEAKMNETILQNVDIGRSAATVSSTSITGMIIVVWLTSFLMY